MSTVPEYLVRSAGVKSRTDCPSIPELEAKGWAIQNLDMRYSTASCALGEGIRPEWKFVAPCFVISRNGVVMQLGDPYHHIIAPIVLSQRVGTNGYPKVNLPTPGAGKRRTCSTHRLLALAFLGSPPTPRHQVNHKNGIKTDNRIENIEWVTPKENMDHAAELGLLDFKRGQDAGSAKFRDAEVAEIKKLIRSGHYYCTAIARVYNVNRRTIQDIGSGATWKHVP